MYIYAIAITAICIVALVKWFLYATAVRGLLFYMGMKYNDVPEGKKMEEIHNEGIRRSIADFLHKS
ncbi:MAG: hypothetical protein PHQ72_14210 [Hespellia sp.]|nr:hypothetical protein [Hespellia sp.]